MNTLFGIILGIIIVFGAFYWEGGNVISLIIGPSLIVVLGGSLVAVYSGTFSKYFFNIPSLIKKSITYQPANPSELITQLVNLSIKAKKEGLLKLEDELKKIDNIFLKKLLLLCIDGNKKEAIDDIAASEINHLSDRHNANIELFRKLGAYSPTLGIIGTVLALINTLASAGDDPSLLIKKIAFAFSATLWGIFFANLIWFPIAEKLTRIHLDEIRIMQLIVDACEGIAENQNPNSIHSKLISYYPLEEQQKYLRIKAI